MDYEKEIERLKAADLARQGEAIAVQAVINGLCRAFAQASPELAKLVTEAFDYADRFAEVGAMNLGSKQPPAHLLAFMETLELMRKAALGGHGEPKDGV